MEPSFTIEQSVVKHGIAVELLVKLAGISAREGYGFKLLTQFETNPDNERPIVYFVGPVDSSKIDVNLVFETGKQSIEYIRIQVLTIPKYPTNAKNLHKSQKIECIKVGKSEVFENIIMPMSDKLASIIEAAISSDKAQDILFDLTSPEWGEV